MAIKLLKKKKHIFHLFLFDVEDPKLANKYYSTLSATFYHNGYLGVTIKYLYRWNFKRAGAYENKICIINKGELITKKRNKK